VTNVLGNLIPLFCNNIKIAVMTFDHEYFKEFCFDEYDNTYMGRINMGNAIRSIQYSRPGQGSGTRYRHTAGAVQCVCNYMLTVTGCGLDVTANCIDVVFFTSGRGNDPVLNVCTEVNCLHNRRGVNTYAFGIGNVTEQELDCMRENDLQLDEYFLFNLVSFGELEQQFQLIINRLVTDLTLTYTCVNPHYDPSGY
jgi:hypothetical protein